MKMRLSGAWWRPNVAIPCRHAQALRWSEIQVQSSELGTNMYQSLRQQAGWQNTISIGDDEPLDFYNATGSQTNANAWLNQMSSGGRNAIIATFSTNNVTDCWNVHNSAQLKNDVYNSARNNGATCGGGQPAYYYCYQTRSN
jgi:hypothetical protein